MFKTQYHRNGTQQILVKAEKSIRKVLKEQKGKIIYWYFFCDSLRLSLILSCYLK